jgi:uncharacterized protein (TIGR02145 family)
LKNRAKFFSAKDFSEKNNKSLLRVFFFILLTVGLVGGGIYYFVNGLNDGASKFANESLKTYSELQKMFFLKKKEIGSAWEIELNIEDTPDFKIDVRNDKSFVMINQRNIKGCPQFSTWEIRNSIEKEHRTQKEGNIYQHHFIARLHYECSVNARLDAKYAETDAACESLVPDFKSICEDVVFDTIASIESTMKDYRDGKTYRTIKIGDQIWMGENLNYRMNDSWCYDDNFSNCTKYGRLYLWNSAKKACPSGWHLPNMAEYGKMFDAVGGEAEGSPKIIGATGFSIQPAGARNIFGKFVFYDEIFLWTSTVEDAEHVHYVQLSDGGNGVGKYITEKGVGLSVRCIKD